VRCCTFDPGSLAPITQPGSPLGLFASAADGRELTPTRLWVEGGTIGNLIVERSILGPIRARDGGKIEKLTLSESIIQALDGGLNAAIGSPPEDSPPLSSPLEPFLNGTAIALDDGDVRLSRCTVLGRLNVHQLHASECILRDTVTVDDLQHGCVRFTAWAQDSTLPRQFESVRIPAGSPLFVSTDFGQPGFAQLLPMADAAILPSDDPDAGPQNTITQGAEDGSEMGAFAREKNPIKARGLQIKYKEFMPAGLIPVVVYVT
jgi:hypothetical protein